MKPINIFEIIQYTIIFLIISSFVFNNILAITSLSLLMIIVSWVENLYEMEEGIKLLEISNE